MRPKRYVVYSLPDDWTPSPPQIPANVSAVWAKPDNVAVLFRDNRRLRKRFQQFLKQGSVGMFYVEDSTWVSYAWMSTPGNSGPPHLSMAQQISAHWIFHCRTQERLRGRGLYKRSLMALAERARGQQSENPLYIDTEHDNTPARCAILSAGFQPHGVADVWTLRVPKLRLWTRAIWHPDQVHPEFVCDSRLSKNRPSIRHVKGEQHAPRPIR